MSIAQETKLRELRAEVDALKVLIAELQTQVADLKAQKPKVGRPPNDRNRAADGD